MLKRTISRRERTNMRVGSIATHDMFDSPLIIRPAAELIGGWVQGQAGGELNASPRRFPRMVIRLDNLSPNES